MIYRVYRWRVETPTDHVRLKHEHKKLEFDIKAWCFPKDEPGLQQIIVHGKSSDVRRWCVSTSNLYHLQTQTHVTMTKPGKPGAALLMYLCVEILSGRGHPLFSLISTHAYTLTIKNVSHKDRNRGWRAAAQWKHWPSASMCPKFPCLVAWQNQFIMFDAVGLHRSAADLTCGGNHTDTQQLCTLEQMWARPVIISHIRWGFRNRPCPEALDAVHC